MLPNGWAENPLSKLLDKVIDYRGQSVPKANVGVPLITARNVREGFLNFDSQEFVDESAYVAWMSRGIPSKGDILFTTEAPLGKACRYPDDRKYAIGQRTVTLRVSPSKLDSDFLLYFILSEHGQRLVDLRSSGSTAKGIKSSELKKIKVLYPVQIGEQKKIAQILSTWDKAIATTEQLLANSQQQKKALMQQLLTGRKRFEGFRSEFERHHFSDLLELDGKSLGNKTPLEFEFKYISLSDVNAGRISESLRTYNFKDAPSRARRILSQGDILLATVRPNLQGFAKVEKKHNGLIASTGFTVLSAKKDVCGDYIYHYLFSAHVTGQINALVVGTNYPAINSSDVAGLLVYCPAYEEQVKIARILNDCDAVVYALQKKLDCLKQEKKALMQQLLTGKRRVKVEQ